MNPIINPRLERKLGRKVLHYMAEMSLTPRTDVRRFAIVKKKCARAIADYTRYTGRDHLLADTDYGYTIS